MVDIYETATLSCRRYSDHRRAPNMGIYLFLTTLHVPIQRQLHYSKTLLSPLAISWNLTS
jgi:hypothetical protein